MEPDLDLLRELLLAFGPCGQEDAVREVRRRELSPAADEGVGGSGRQPSSP